MINAAILGASGYVGGELMRLSHAHPGIEVARAFGASAAGKPVRDLHPHLGLAYRDRTFDAWDPALLDGCDLVFAALPHGESQRMVDAIGDRKIVDLGADFRLDSAEDYQRWYGEPHQRPDLLGSFVYGLPEFRRADIAAATRVAAPGCYPTAANLALKPLIDAGAIEPKGIIVDAASGVSGAGRSANAGHAFLRGRRQAIRAYGLTAHRHTAEMEMVSGARCCSPRISWPPAAASSPPATPLRSARPTRWRSCARPMPTSRSSMSARLCPRPNGRPDPTPPSSPPAMTSAPAGSSRSPRSTISARARRGR